MNRDWRGVHALTSEHVDPMKLHSIYIYKARVRSENRGGEREREELGYIKLEPGVTSSQRLSNAGPEACAKAVGFGLPKNATP